MRFVRLTTLSIGTILALLAFAVAWRLPRAAAQPAATWPSLRLTRVTGGLSRPVHLTHAGDGSGRIFVVEQGGRIKIIQNNQVAGTFLDIAERVQSPQSTPPGGNEEGLLSVAFPPGFGSQRNHFYVYYTNRDGNNQVSRFRLGANPNSADPNSEELILLFEHPTYNNHNGGQLAFGPDGYLYIGTGDGGGGGDPFNNAQNPNSLLGKLLRIDVEMGPLQPIASEHHTYMPLLYGATSGASARYRIPPDNPFINQPGYRPEIWALGLRNPWRFSFDRSPSAHDLFIGDVGQNLIEEIDWQPASSDGGENYGWDILEGNSCYGGGSCDTTGMTMPIYTYPNPASGCASVTGGFVYRGSTFAGMQGIYYFADYCSGVISGLQLENNQWVAQALVNAPAFQVSSFGEDEAGELYVTYLSSGEVFRIEETPAP